MDIAEIRKEKAALEDKIRDFLNAELADFRKKTGERIGSISCRVNSKYVFSKDVPMAVIQDITLYLEL